MSRQRAGSSRRAPTITIGRRAVWLYRPAVAVIEAQLASDSRKPAAVLARNVALLTGSQVTTWCVTLAWSLIVPRAVGPAEMGVYTLGVASGGVLTVIIGLGIRPLLVREIAADPERTSQLVGTAIVLRGLIALPVLALTIVIALVAPFGPEEAVALCLGWGMCIFFLIYEPVQATFQARERMRYLAYADILTKTGVSIGGIVLVLLGVRAVGLLVTSISVMAAVMVVNFWWARNLVTIDWRVTLKKLGSLLVASLPYWSFAAFFTIYLWIDSLMLGALTSSTVVGWYGLPTRLFGTLMFIPTILSTAWLPQMVRGYTGGGDGLWKSARTSLELVLILSLPVAAGTILVAPDIIRVLYGSAFAESVPVLIVLALCLPPMYFNTMANQVLIARKRQMDWTKVMVLATIVNPICNVFLIRYFQRAHGNGAIGAAISLLITEVIISAIGVVLIRRALGTGTLLRIGKALVATAAMGFVVQLALHHGGLAVAIVAGLVTFPAFAFVLGLLTDEERAYAMRLLARVLRRRPPAHASSP